MGSEVCGLWRPRTESCGPYTIPCSVLGWMAGLLDGWMHGWLHVGNAWMADAWIPDVDIVLRKLACSTPRRVGRLVPDLSCHDTGALGS